MLDIHYVFYLHSSSIPSLSGLYSQEIPKQLVLHDFIHSFFLQLYLLSVPFIIISFQTRIYFDCFFPISPIKTYNSYGHEFYLFCLLICHLSFVGDLFVFGSETANRVDCVVFWAYSEEEVRGTQR